MIPRYLVYHERLVIRFDVVTPSRCYSFVSFSSVLRLARVLRRRGLILHRGWKCLYWL